MIKRKHKEPGALLATAAAGSLVRADLRDLRLNGADMPGDDLRTLDFTSALLGGAVLRDAHVAGADFRGVELASLTVEFANPSKARSASITGYRKTLR